jgi:hypothetical protein
MVVFQKSKKNHFLQKENFIDSRKYKITNTALGAQFNNV